MGDIVGSVAGLFGVEGGESVNPLGFNPGFTQSPLGTADFGPSNIALGLSPELQQAYSGLLGASQQRLGQSQDLEGTLGFLSRVIQPQFERQQLSQESRLFNQGLLGSTTGQLQQQGLREAQNQTLLQNALQAQAQQTQQAQGLLGNALQVAQQPLNLAQLSLQRAGGQLQADEGTAGLRQQADANQANFFASLVSSGSKFATGGA